MVARLTPAVFAALSLSGFPAAAQDVQEQCRAKLRPAVQACVAKQVKEQGGPPTKHVEGCRKLQAAPFQACVAGTATPAQAPAAEPAAPPADTALRLQPDRAFQLRRAAAQHLRHHRDPGPGEAGPEQDRQGDAPRPRPQPPASAARRPSDRSISARCQARASDRPQPRRHRRLRAGDRAGRRLPQRDQPLSASSLSQSLSAVVGEYREVDRGRAGHGLNASWTMQPRGKGRFFGINLRIALTYFSLGELAQAEVYFKKQPGAAQRVRRAGRTSRCTVSTWASTVENGNARLFEARGQLPGGRSRLSPGT